MRAKSEGLTDKKKAKFGAKRFLSFNLFANFLNASESSGKFA